MVVVSETPTSHNNKEMINRRRDAVEPTHTGIHTHTHICRHTQMPTHMRRLTHAPRRHTHIQAHTHYRRTIQHQSLDSVLDLVVSKIFLLVFVYIFPWLSRAPECV